MPEVYENLTVVQNLLSSSMDFAFGNDLPPMSNNSVLSPYQSSLDSQGNSASPMSTTSSPLHMPNYITLHTMSEQTPYLTIIEQPIEKFRFRYKSEMMGTHGSLVGTNSMTNRKKSAPTVRLHNYSRPAIMRCTLVTSSEGQRIPHAHRLIRRDIHADQDDPHHIKISADDDYTAVFHGMGIIHTAKKHIKEELVRKMKIEALEKIKRKNINAVLSIREEAQIKTDAETYQKCMNLNSVALCFQAFALDQNEIMVPITEPIYSNAINNLKSALTGELKICRIDKYCSSCDGGEEVFILVEKVGKKNIKIKLFELNEDDEEIWRDYGRFSELDVHHQYAIVFKTPPYKDLNITSTKEVFIQLERPSDAEFSEPLPFTYKPSDRLHRKRPRISNSDSSTELSNIRTPALCTGDPNVTSTSDNRTSINSVEVKAILEDGVDSNEYKQFINEINLGAYDDILACSEENMLVSDGSPIERDDVSFEKNFISKAAKAMKMDSKKRKQKLSALLNDRHRFGDSPLHAALRHSNQNMVKYILMLIASDPDYQKFVNVQNSSGKTPLHYAVLQNEPEVVKALLKLKADPNTYDEHGSSPLHDAAKCADAGVCVDILLTEKSIKIEEHNDAGWTPLHLAAKAGAFHAVRSLVKAGADVNKTDMSYGRTALYIAVEGSHKEIVEFFLTQTNVDVNKRNFSGNTALHSAVVNSGSRAKELCKLLKDHGADPHIPNHDRESNNIDKRGLSGVDIKKEVDSDTEEGQTSLDLASEKPEILRLLNDDDSEARIAPKQEISNDIEEMDESDDNQKVVLTSEQKIELAEILDQKKDGEKVGWKKLVTHLNLEYLLNTLENSRTSPSLLLINYIINEYQLEENPLSRMADWLKEIGEQEAALYLSQTLSKKL